jgi:hypothetical protein
MSESKITLDSIIKGKEEKPLRQIVYGLDGVGKTHYVYGADGIIVLAFEDGQSEFDGQKIPLFGKDRGFLDGIDAERLIYANHKKLGIKTVGIDSLDRLEEKIFAHVCKTNKVDSIEQIGFGKGYVMALHHWQTFLSGLDSLRALGLDIVLIGHSQIVKIDDPTTEAYDRHDIKLDKRVRGMVREWADFVSYAQFETHSFKAGEKFGQSVYKASSTGNRIMHTVQQPAFEAKSRVSIPSPIPLDWKTFKSEIAKARKGSV